MPLSVVPSDQLLCSIKQLNTSSLHAFLLFAVQGRAAVGGSGPLVQETKEFTYDYSYWSVDSDDAHFISQEKVSQ